MKITKKKVKQIAKELGESFNTDTNVLEFSACFAIELGDEVNERKLSEEMSKYGVDFNIDTPTEVTIYK